MNHREPGLAGAVLDHPQARGELICDGVHIHPAVVRLAFRLLGEDRAVVVSDSMRGAGMPDGEYTLGGQKVRVQRGKALLENGAIAGSVTNLHQELRNLLEYGVPMKEAIKAMTINPAVQLGVAEDTGSIEEGKYADLVVLDRNYDIYMVMVKGTIIEKHGKKAALEDLSQRPPCFSGGFAHRAPGGGTKCKKCREGAKTNLVISPIVWYNNLTP